MRRTRGGVAMFLKTHSFCVERPDGPVYFKIVENNDQSHDDVEAKKVYDVFSNGAITYVSSFVRNASFAKNIERHHKLKDEVLSRSDKVSQYSGAIAFNATDHFEYGHFVKLPEDVPAMSFLEDVRKKQLLGDSPVFTARMTNGKAVASIDDDNSTNLLTISPMSTPILHPAFIFCDTNSVYRDIERVYSVLNQYASLPEVKELQGICNQYIQETKDWKSQLPFKAKNLVIVIEGLDATGKTTLARNLTIKLNGPVLKSPPECTAHLRSKFDAHPELLRRAYYALGNYAFGAIIREASGDGIIVVDRFWHSTAAYAIAKEVSVGGVDCLPPIGHEIYKWPPDLLQPDAVVLLTINDEERRRRLISRGSVKTDEEIRLEQSSHFRQRLEGAYLRMQTANGPIMLEVDASGTEEEVLSRTLELLRSKNLLEDVGSKNQSQASD